MIGVGDLVVCVDVGPNFIGLFPALVEGQVYTVSALTGRDMDGEPCCRLSGANSRRRRGFLLRRFRKVQHDKREACETEFVTLLKRAKVKEPQS